MSRNIMAFSRKSIKYHLSMKGTVMQIEKALYVFQKYPENSAF